MIAIILGSFLANFRFIVDVVMQKKDPSPRPSTHTVSVAVLGFTHMTKGRNTGVRVFYGNHDDVIWTKTFQGPFTCALSLYLTLRVTELLK